MNTIGQVVALSAMLAFAGLSGAQTSGRDGQTAFLSGGVGQGEVEAMRRAAGDYNLRMTFTEQGGQYLADVAVDVRKPNGETVLSTISDGPMIFVDLPPGNYVVDAEFGGRTQTRRISLGRDKHREMVMRWRSPDESRESGAAGPKASRMPPRREVEVP